MATLGGLPPDLLARLGQFSDENRMALLGGSMQLLGGGGFTGAGNAMMLGSKVDQSNRYLKQEQADKKKKEAEDATTRAALEAAIGKDNVARMGLDGAKEYFRATELLKAKPKEPEDRYQSEIDPKSGIEYQTNIRTGQRSVLNKPESAKESRLPEFYERDPNNPQAIRPIPGGKFDPNAPRPKPQLTVGDRDAIQEADNSVATGKAAMDSLARAIELNDKAYSGAGASTRAWLARNTGGIIGDAEKGANTTEFNNVVMEQALSQMKAIFGANPTEGERAALLEMQSSVDKSPEERKRLLDRAQQRVEQRVERNRKKAQAIRSGDYYDPDFDPEAAAKPQGQQPTGNLPTVRSPDEAAKLPKGTRFVDPNGIERVVP